MDPILIIRLAGSIVGIIDVATKSLKALNELRLRLSEADLIFATHNAIRYFKRRTWPDCRMDKFESCGRPVLVLSAYH